MFRLNIMYGLIYQIIHQGGIGQIGGSMSRVKVDLPILLLALVIYLTLVILVGSWIWNNVLVRVTTLVKPLNSWYDILLLVVLFHLLYPSGKN